MKKLISLLLIFTITACSSTMVSNNDYRDEFYSKVNYRCYNKHVKVITKSGEETEGIFAKLNDTELKLWNLDETISIPIESISKLRYRKGFSTGGICFGSFVGLSAGIIYWLLNEPDFSLWGGSTNSETIIFVPLIIIVAAITGASFLDKYNTIYFE